MNKKLLIGLITTLVLVFSSSLCFANDALNDATHGAQNVVGGAENAIKDTMNGVTDATKNMTNKAENGMNNITNSMKENGDNNNTKKDTNNETANRDNNNNYTAVRTSAEGTTTFMGMNATTWTWLIIGIAAIAIIALVWYYSAQFANSNYKDRD